MVIPLDDYYINLGYGLACVIDIMCNTLSGIGAGFLTGGGGLLFQAYDIEAFCDKEVILNILCNFEIKLIYLTF